MRRGLLGGTFDPIHTAHLIAGEVAYRQLELDVVTFLPAGAPWQKGDRTITDQEHRWEMTRRAVDGIDYFEADDREVTRDGWTYTIDTLASFPEDDLYLILGADAAAGLPTWNAAEEVLERVTLGIVPRPGTPAEVVEAVVGDVQMLDMPLLAISGTEIRQRWSAQRPVRFMVPESVYAYAEERHLYG